jgi:hypothetical protein
MARWEDDDCWSDADDPRDLRHVRPTRPLDEAEPEPAPPLVPVEEAFVGSVYWVSDRLWKIPPSDRVAHPGICVRCDLRSQRAVMVKGTSVRENRAWRYNCYAVVVVEPTAENGLIRPTAFALEPRNIDLRILRRVHLEEGPRGRVAPEVLRAIEEGLAELERALTEARR